ncbi:MAG: DNA mismatch repair protein MutS [Desulfosarcinaceae bacterium]|nr:DNA mismatch repair protein MutS [Desulfosarcinaceae bacterium]
MANPKATPMMQQYLAIKAQYPDAILFYRMGDFYEMFFEDAKVASKILDIALTSRNKKDDNPIPMCGVPYRAAQTYVARLIDSGQKVAVCDQMEDPSKTKGLVKREVVRVITPGMIIENELLDANAHNWVLCVARSAKALGMACLDLSTATFRVTESDTMTALIEEVQRIGPRELLLNEADRGDSEMTDLLAVVGAAALTDLPAAAFQPAAARELLLEQLGTVSLEGFGCEGLVAGVAAAGALLSYVRDTQKRTSQHISKIETYHLEDYLMVDDLSCRNLELFANTRTGGRQGTLIAVLDKTVTAMGGRELAHWLRYPLMDPIAIETRYDAIEDGLGNLSRVAELREILKAIADLERLRGKISMGHANARDLLALKRSLQALPTLATLLDGVKAELLHWREPMAPLNDLAAMLAAALREDAPPTLNEGGLIKIGFNAELDTLIALSRDGKSWLAELEVREKDATGIASLKVRYNKVFGYYLEIPKSHSAKAPDHYVRKQTLVNAERYITDELKQFEAKVLGAEAQRIELENRIFQELRSAVLQQSEAVQRVAEFIARLDTLLALTMVADQNDYRRPRLNSDGLLAITDGRHPVVEQVLTGERFVPNTITMDNVQHQILVITGPNMAGKSTVLRQVALMVILAQSGAFVPAAELMAPITDRIFTRVGALDNLSAGQSTFMVEMQETANILNHATSNSLVIMDEIGRGTSTYDGLSIAWAVAEFLHDLNGTGVKTLFATHYHELTELTANKPRVRNYNIAVKEWNDEIIFLRKLVAGGTNRSYGIQVARLAGIPETAIKRAKQILARIESQESGHISPVHPADGETPPTASPMQLSLFQTAEQQIVSDLVAMDIGRMTPIEALNVLDRLQKKAST